MVSGKSGVRGQTKDNEIGMCCFSAKHFSMWWCWGSLCTFIMLAHWNNSKRLDMWLQSDTLFWFRANQSLHFLINSVCLAEKQHIPISLSLVWPRTHDLPLTIYVCSWSDKNTVELLLICLLSQWNSINDQWNLFYRCVWELMWK
jgi:hypothetical protein